MIGKAFLRITNIEYRFKNNEVVVSLLKSIFLVRYWDIHFNSVTFHLFFNLRQMDDSGILPVVVIVSALPVFITLYA
jgi:hypothetical protein